MQPLTVLVRLRSLGDTVLMTPLLEVLKRAGRRTGVISEAPFHEVLLGNPYLDELIVISGHRRWLARLKAVRTLRKWKPEEVIDLHGGTTAALITAVSGAPRKVGYEANRHSHLYDIRVPDTRGVWGKSTLHTVEHQLAPLKLLNYPVEPVPSLHVSVDPGSLQTVRRLLEERQVEEDFILVHPAAAFDTKRWATENFARVCDRLVHDGRRIVLVGGPGDEELVEAVRVRMETEGAVIPPLSIRDFAALASLCRLYLGNDTGPTHIAAAVVKPVVVIFGSSNWRVWHPWGAPYRLLHADLECIPCPGYTCLYYDEPRCIQQITVDQVYAAVKELLS